MSPSGMSNAEAGGMILSSFGQLSSALVSFTYYIRPVISLKASDIVEAGNGSQTNPYVISTN